MTPHAPGAGFALPIVTILIAMAALLALESLSAASQATGAATSARLRQRAFNAAETGLARTLAALDRNGPRPDTTHSLAPDERADVHHELTMIERLPEGFSAGRVRAERYAIRSIGRVGSGHRIELSAGATRFAVSE
jgi:Tfp pilus assembly protein PilX